MALAEALATVREAPFIVDVLRAADDLALAASRDGGRRAAALLTEAILDPRDELTAIAAVHALGRVFDGEADGVLSDLLSHERGYLREHASWTLDSRLPRVDAIGRLVAVLAAGGFPGMLAQRTLARWAVSAPDHVGLAVEGALAGASLPEVRARLAETLGLVPGGPAARAVFRLASDPAEAEPVRVAAVAALGDGGQDARDPRAAALLRCLARTDGGQLGAVARLAELDRRLAAELRVGLAPTSGTVVAQLFLHADIDRGLTRSGAGDTGGVATLLLRLGDALAAEPGVDRVLTLSRGGADAAMAALAHPVPARSDRRHDLLPVPLLQPPVGMAQAWPARVAAERGIRRALLAAGPLDVLHLRMADVGSLAAATVAAELGVPVVFTLAPDPHAVIHSLDMSGALTRGGFGTADEREHYWFRARLVQRLAADAAHDVLFPRPELDHDLQQLLGVDRASEPRRYTVVPEGIDLAVTEAAALDVVVRESGAPGIGELEELIGSLPPQRQGLPLAVSVGRLHRVKGMATVVQAWAGDPALRARCNLLIVGGDLDRPSPDEREQLDLIASTVPPGERSATGLLLTGHRPNDVVARWLALAAVGREPLIGAGGVYVCGSLKEEFGLAVVEAMAAGLIVVGPRGGGPATYVVDGVDGVLVDTRSPSAVAAGMVAALGLALAPDPVRRAAVTRDSIRDHLTVQAMATRLARVYSGVAVKRFGAAGRWAAGQPTTVRPS